jgi:hypothetical protein
MEAGAVLCHRGRVLVPAVMNEAWRTFCRPGTNFIEHYECRYKFDRSCEFIPGYKVGGGYWRSVAVQAVSEPEVYQGAGFQLRTDERVRVQQQLQICLGCRSKSKKCDKQLTFIVRVRWS